MSPVMPPPFSPVVPVTETLHGISVTDPYRWLEDQDSAETRSWITEQSRYARAYLDSLAGRVRIRERVRAFVDVETNDSFLIHRTRYFFRKRRRGEEQPSIYLREGSNGPEELLIDPACRGTGPYTALRPLRVSPDGNLLLYEVKEGGERTGIFEIFDVKNRRRLPDALPRGFLRGFAFTPDSKNFYYVHEAVAAERPYYRAAYHHVLGTDFEKDQEIFCAGDDPKRRLVMVPGRRCLGLLVYRFLDQIYTDFYLLGMGSAGPPVEILREATYNFVPCFVEGRILALTNRHAPNRKIVEVQPRKYPDPHLLDLVPESERMICAWIATAHHIVVSYARGTNTQIETFDSYGARCGPIPCRDDETVRIVAGDCEADEILLERESFVEPIGIHRYSLSSGTSTLWCRHHPLVDASAYAHTELQFLAKDGTNVPMFLVGRRDRLTFGIQPTIMTSYGGYGIPTTPRFSILTNLLMERGCLLALPNIRGGSEFGERWHQAAKRKHRQVAFDDFLSAAEFLIASRRTSAERLAIFGGSNSGLLVAAAMTQRPQLFCAVLCLVPLADMLRYHLFDNAHVWGEEFGTAENEADFRALVDYSPYHGIRDGTAYPATMFVSGDADQNCNALHARKMTARLQAASSSEHPIFLDYHQFRGHSPVLPLSIRIEALTDRIAFLAAHLQLSA